MLRVEPQKLVFKGYSCRKDGGGEEGEGTRNSQWPGGSWVPASSGDKSEKRGAPVKLVLISGKTSL